ncbi:murein hydrolase activator EnvC family protein [Gilvibacter sediminis]|uniref:murein hydrolase activator EnvC family protein n=1 Tax=Gilvibacter sediminis TaxID=379071 RepID=UPI002350A69F|nr:peptidoglycan DD-metalloendopeptidase family protein [Gilvibacter sediminis]MDC7996754.1 peptidoglycan DD-metalloendopeptidase family protein [Gilvibacter sediminis]
MTLRLLFISLLTLLLCSNQAQAQKDERTVLEEKRQEILQEIKQINLLLFDTQKKERSVLSEVEDIDKRIRAQENLIRITNRQANLLTREINVNLKKIDQLREELAQIKEDYAQMVVKSYKSKSRKSRIMFLLSSRDFLQAYKRVQYMNQYAKYRKEQGESIQRKTLELQELNKSLLEQQKQKQALIAENKKTKEALRKEKEQQEALVAELKKDESKFASQIRSKQKQADEIDRQIDALVRAAIVNSNNNSGADATGGSSSTFALTAEAKALGNSFTSNKGKLPWPVTNGVVVKRFGKHRHPQLPNVETFCSGVEIATSTGADARSIFDGVVLDVKQIKGANKLVQIQHGSYISVYYNLSSVSVSPGDKVTTKQQIGTIAKNPASGKTIIKLLIYKNTTRLNPADWVYRM